MSRPAPRWLRDLGRAAVSLVGEVLRQRSGADRAQRSRRPRTPPRGVVPTVAGRPEISYAPVRDDDADPGEVVWTWVPYEDDPSQGKDRPVVVIGRFGDDVAALALTSRAHDDPHHHPLGSGPWDREGRPSWVKLDRVLRLDPDGMRREGAVLDRSRFDRVVAAWEAYGATEP